MTENAGAKDRWLARPPLKAQPTEMNAQELWYDGELQQDNRPNVHDPLMSRIIGVALLLATILTTFAFASALYNALALHNGGTPLHYLFLGLSTLAFAWVAFGAANAFLGACCLLAGTDGNSIVPAPAEAPVGSRTALLFPVYHEDARQIAAAIRDLVRDLEDKGAIKAFAFFVVSDSQTQEDRTAERDIFRSLSREIGGKVTFAIALTTSARRPGTLLTGFVPTEAVTTTSLCSTQTVSCPPRHSCSWSAPCRPIRIRPLSRQCHASPLATPNSLDCKPSRTIPSAP